MLYFFYGADGFRLRQKVNSVIAQYRLKHKSGLNFGRFDLALDEEFSKLKFFLDSYSMFAEKKLAILENLFEAPLAAKEQFLEYLSSGGIIKDQESFVLVAQELARSDDKNKKEKYSFKDAPAKELFKKLTAKTVNTEEFDLLSGAKLENWIKKEAEKGGANIEPAAIKKLAAYVGADLWQMSNEIKKLASFKNGELIRASDIDALVKSKIDADIFKTIDALAQRQKASAFKFLHQNLEQGKSEIYLLGMLVYQFRNLLLLKDQLERGAPLPGLEKKLKLHPFVLRKTFALAKNFSLPALKKIYQRLSEIDYDIKTGRVEPRPALDLIVAEITG